MQRSQHIAMCETNKTRQKENVWRMEENGKILKEGERKSTFFAFHFNTAVIIFGRVSNISLGSFVKWPVKHYILFIRLKDISLTLPFSLVPSSIHTIYLHRFCSLSPDRLETRQFILVSLPLLGNSIFMYFSKTILYSIGSFWTKLKIKTSNQ